ncbi:16S rRNA (cytosine(1402)-N(4))-methyltransferase RsmH [Henriciella mobilis]|uniref:Ribosomal RNA small subunit methyltransferase H n=1 Tax=Henriciella mobilis TaxID=2305467 RepID=A0A399RRW1_9PROT|nr:16S rRNA (cytosine(1402)-N(4))-methyltransferase RsmH [Henriciella mobilis]RIJ32637.1 16S rRNA (cytosine(1402)-N(4))-methyltransferase RsmH [Henriciella mobilis]
MGHKPVLLDEVVAAMAPKTGEVLVDGTYGGGGYARALLAAAKCRVIGIDRDLDAIERASAAAEAEDRLIPVLGRFGDMRSLVNEAGFETVDAITLDLGVSSFQLDQAHRGFSFMRDGPLDMRMGRSGPSAADVVNQMDERDLATIFFRLGEEKQSRRIARAIVQRRLKAPFTTTLDLADLIEEVLGGRRGARTHPATRSFQAIRMFVNDELGELARALEASELLLNEGGRLVIVTFHSLEDRMVKLFMRERSGLQGGGSRHLPEKEDAAQPSFDMPSKKAIEPSDAELEVNPRARSSRLRVAVRTDAPAMVRPVSAGVDLPSLELVEASS